MSVLDEFIAHRGLQHRVSAHYGVDQGDRSTLERLVSDEFGDEPIDLVIDDASHFLEETRSSFETLFPRLRPGGLFSIEDWRGDYIWWVAVEMARRGEASCEVPDDVQLSPQLSRLAIELVLTRLATTDVIREVTFRDSTILVRRGDEPIAPEDLRLAALNGDVFGMLDQH